MTCKHAINRWIPQPFPAAVFAVLIALLTGTTSAAGDEPNLRQVACQFKPPAEHTVTCYRLRVPETRHLSGQEARRKGEERADGRSARTIGKVSGNGLEQGDMKGQTGWKLDLPIVVISTPKDRRHDDPVIYLSGGPGDGDWLDAQRIGYWWGFLADSPWLRHRDFILFDQRGVGLTEPRADCPELAALNVSGLTFGNDHQKAAAASRAAAAACLTRLQREGHDVAAYTTEASAEDLHNIFQALHLPRWNVYGLSYGTRLALTYMRLHPEDIRTTILDSVYPPQVHFLEDDAWRTERSFQLLFAACDQDQACHRWYPDLSKRLQALVDRLNTTPLIEHRLNPDDGAELTFPITGETLLTHLFFNLYNRDDIQRIPQIIDIFDRNLKRLIAKEIDLLIEELDDRPDWGDAMATTIDCLEDVPFNDSDKIRANYRASTLLRSFADADPAPLCQVWVKQLPVTAMNQPVTSDLPSLILTGINDPVTPPSYAQLAASHLSHSFYVEFPSTGHDVLGNNPCANLLAEAFLDQPEKAPKASCLSQPQRFKFASPVER